MQKWQNTEYTLSSLCNRRDKDSYTLKIRLIIFIVFSAAFGMCLEIGSRKMVLLENIVTVEHALSDGSLLHYIIICQREREVLINFVKLNVPYIDHIPIWAALFINFINISATFVWNYTDIFIMIVSIGLSTHFKLINKELEMANFEVSRIQLY